MRTVRLVTLALTVGFVTPASAQIKKGIALEQVKAAAPTSDYDGRYGATSGFWTTDMFVEAAYRTLGGK